MELKKTTVLSALVGAAGILSEIMFHDIMTTSIAGIVLSVVLTVIVVASVYFTMDGIFCILKEEREIAQKRQEEYEQKMYRIANEQLQFQKATYKEVHSLRQAGGGVVSPAAPITGSGENLLDKGTLEQLVQAVNENTMTASKIVAKYVNKNTMDIKFAIEQLQQEIPSVAEAIAVNREMLQNVENANSEILQHVESANRELLQSVETAIKEMEEQLASIEAKSAEQNVVTQNPPLSAADIFHLEEAPVAASLGEEVESLEELSMTSELDLNPSVMDMTEEAEIPEALEILGKKYPMAIVSNKPDWAVKPLCQRYFPGICARGESQDCLRKPAPDMVFRAMADIGVQKCVYVGDSEVDLLTAKNAAVPCLCVLWGFRDREQLAEGKYFCETQEQLPEMIERIIEEIYGK